MKFRVGACALLVCLAGCSAESPDMKSGQKGTASADAGSTRGRPSVQLERTPSQSVANAPDRGALIDYKNKGAAIKRQGAYTWYPVAISEAHALKAVVAGEMTIPSPDGSQVKVRYDRHVEHPDGNWTWIGRVVGGDQRQEAILTFGEKAVFGSIPQKNGFALSLQTRNGVLYAVQADLSKVKSPNTGTTDVMVPPAMALRSALLASAPKAQVAQAAVEGKASAANTIDVAIGFTQGFAADLGSESAAVTRLVFLVDVGNQAFTNSLINGALRIVRAVPVTYTDATTNQSALEELSGFNEDGSVPVPASLAPIRTARDQYGADLAVLVRKFQMPENDGCGIAWLIGANETLISPTIDDDLGYGVVSDGDDSYEGNSYFCAAETLVHELGHLMGSAHDRDNAVDDNGVLVPGRYPYSFGMKTTSANGNFYTIMAYGDDGQNFYRTFSNPLVVKCGPSGNLACGVANQTDNARSLNQTIPVVATFRAMVVPLEGVANLHIIKKQGGSGHTELHSLTGSSNFQSYSRNLATILPNTGNDRSWDFQLGNYNTDTTADLYAVKKNGASGKTEVHVMNGTGGFKSYLLNVATALASTGSDGRWEFRLGDYNKDGKPDLYGINRTGSSGKTEVHILNGADRFQTYLLHSATALGATGTDDSWKFDLGDYNRDNNPDLYAVKKNGTSGRTEVHVLNGSGGFKTFLLNKATALGATGTNNLWEFKIADYDLDGRPDLYGIKKVGGAGKTEVHVLSGSSIFQSFVLQKSTALGNTGTDYAWEFIVSK